MEKRYPVSHLGGDANQIDVRVSMATDRVPTITASASGPPKQQGRRLHMPLLKVGIAAVEAQSALPLSVVSTSSEGLLPGSILIQGNMQVTDDSSQARRIAFGVDPNGGGAITTGSIARGFWW
ncbi:hypothetical protein NE237_026025 [Protea cynaroides]|uniref:Uncharacterized protein n=1 Tax=Protea cynaroides TaxID=273540 RepID=A0A9Q0H853_9MAGN|nr:hypothetical protein NE237_026025 [Protea cynaroides]